jgi:hypothetical protein
MLSSFRRCLVAWLQRPMGRVAVFALLVAVISGASRWEIHGHVEVAPALAHLLVHAIDRSGDQQLPPDQQAPGDAMLHAHTVCTSDSSLSETPQLTLSSIPRALHDPIPVVAAVITSRQSPPHRPPIA